jgi:glycosyltransferase involved in cell wall biosynthesis
VIVVDDGSSDRSLEVIKVLAIVFAGKRSRIKVEMPHATDF